MMNFGIGRSPQNYLSSFGPNYNNNNRNIGIQYIRNRKNNTAFRFGISSYHQNMMGSYTYTTQQDTTTYYYKYYTANIPKLSVGMEWQKRLHPDVMIYAGVDAQLGAMFAKQDNTTMVRVDSTDYYRWSGTTTRGPLAIGASIRPFVGMRANWSRFVFSYELASPIDFTSMPGYSSNLNGMQLKHTISLGYMFKAKKH